jgi:4,5-DOPA dioxygenase extradiol
MYPEADIPVVQVSVQTALGPAHHLRLGEALAPLAREGVLVIGSGHATHNLGDWLRTRGEASPLAYVEDFRRWLHARLAAGDRDALLGYRDATPGAVRAHPTEEHFLPLFVALGAAGAGAGALRVHEGLEGAALAMDAWRFG